MDDVWSKSREELVYTVTGLGFPAELGEAMAKQLGSPKAIDRMTAYLNYERPTNVNMVVDEMLRLTVLLVRHCRATQPARRLLRPSMKLWPENANQIIRIQIKMTGPVRKNRPC